jgi:tight adherence protein B
MIEQFFGFLSGGLLGEALVISSVFASVSAGIAAAGMLLRDLFTRTRTNRQRLEFVPEEPTGALNGTFFRLVEESGTSMDMNAAMAMVFGGAIVGVGIPLVFFDHLLGAGIGGLVGATIPIVYLSIIRWWRIGAMRKNLPHALQATADAVRGGQTLSEACELVSQEIKGPLGTEFAYAHQQLELGHAPIAVMNRMARRVPLPEFRVFATAVTVHRRAGGNLSLLTERMSRAARDRQEVRSHLLAVTSGSRLSAIGMVAVSIFAAVFLTMLEPQYLQAFLNNPKGPWLLATAVGLQVVGGLWVWRILKTSY